MLLLFLFRQFIPFLKRGLHVEFDKIYQLKFPRKWKLIRPSSFLDNDVSMDEFNLLSLPCSNTGLGKLICSGQGQHKHPYLLFRVVEITTIPSHYSRNAYNPPLLSSLVTLTYIIYHAISTELVNIHRLELITSTFWES